MVRWVSKHCDPVMATGWHMVLGSLPLAALSLAREGDELLPRLAQIDGALISWLKSGLEARSSNSTAAAGADRCCAEFQDAGRARGRVCICCRI